LKTESLLTLPVDIRIYNQAMQVIYHKEKALLQPGSATNIDVSGMCPGVYFLAIQSSSGGSVLKKFIVGE